MAQNILTLIVMFVVTFLLGSIPFGVIVSKLFYHTDIREHGSGNIGTTNAMRTLGKVGGVSVFVLDFSKGVLSGCLAGVFFNFMAPLADFASSIPSYDFVFSIAFLGCVWGHIFSPWLHFKGGKGIAAAVGCLFVGFGFVGAWLEIAIFAVLILITKYVSVGSMAAAFACPFFAMYYFSGDWPAILLCAITGLTIVWAHRGNIARLRDGVENRIGGKKGQDKKSEVK